MKGDERRWSGQISVDAESRLTFFTYQSLTLIYKKMNKIMGMFFNLLLYQFIDE